MKAPEYIKQKNPGLFKNQVLLESQKLRDKYFPEIRPDQNQQKTKISEYSNNEAQTEEDVIKYIKFQIIKLHLKQIDPGSLINNLDAIFNQKNISNDVMAIVMEKILEDTSIELENQTINIIRSKIMSGNWFDKSVALKLLNTANNRARQNQNSI